MARERISGHSRDAVFTRPSKPASRGLRSSANDSKPKAPSSLVTAKRMEPEDEDSERNALPTDCTAIKDFKRKSSFECKGEDRIMRPPNRSQEALTTSFNPIFSALNPRLIIALQTSIDNSASEPVTSICLSILKVPWLPATLANLGTNRSSPVGIEGWLNDFFAGGASCAISFC